MRLTKFGLVAALAYAQLGLVSVLAATHGHQPWPAVEHAVAGDDAAAALALAAVVLFAGCVLLAHRRDGAGTLGLAGACALGAVFAVVAAGEPATWQILDPRAIGLPGALLAGLGLVLLALVPVLGIQELLERRLAFID